MEITKLIDSYGDDVFAFALIVTKNFASAKEVFVKTSSCCEEFSEEDGLFPLIKKAYSECSEVESNESASALTEIDLDSKRQEVLEQLLVRRETVRAAAHMFYENDFDIAQIADITGQSKKYINELLISLNDGLADSLEAHYKDICTVISASDELKSYVIRAVSSGDKRLFEVREEAVPIHTWKLSHKIIVIIAAIIAVMAIMVIIPLFQKYTEMRESEAGLSYDEIGTDESFYYTYEAETVEKT